MFDLRKYLFLPIFIFIPFYSDLVCAEPLTLADCLEVAAKNNGEVLSARASLKALEYQQNGTLSNFLPQISANLGYNHGNSTTPQNQSVFGSNAGLNSNSLTNTSFTAAINASQNIFAGFQDVYRYKQAKFMVEASKASLQLILARITYDVTASFENLSYAQNYIALTKEIMRRRQDNLNLVRIRFQGGRENKGSELLSDAYYQQSTYDNLQAENARRVSRAQLARSLGIEESEKLEIVAHTDELKNVDSTRDHQEFYSTPNFKDLVPQTPEFNQSVAQEGASRQSIAISRSLFFPQLNLSGSVGRSDNDFFPRDTKRWSVGANLTWALFNGGRDYNATSSSEENWIASRFNRENTSRVILFRLEQTFATLQEAALKFKVDRSFKIAVSVRAEIARKKYNNGLLTFEDWDIIENDLINRQKIFLQSSRDRVLAEASWQQALGRNKF